jgi:hypothetical protein
MLQLNVQKDVEIFARSLFSITAWLMMNLRIGLIDGPFFMGQGEDSGLKHSDQAILFS